MQSQNPHVTASPKNGLLYMQFGQFTFETSHAMRPAKTSFFTLTLSPPRKSLVDTFVNIGHVSQILVIVSENIISIVF